ncbi:MAG: putative zinc-binding protein [Candidatus Syntrophosphaera sp.]
MAEEKCGCSCSCGDTGSCDSGCVTNAAPATVYACAGASNVGIISLDLAVALHRANHYKMGCSACVGAGDCSCGEVVDPATPRDLLIDGCKVGCLKKMFEKQGKTHFNHVIVTQMGVCKEPSFDYEPSTLEMLMKKLSGQGL